MGEISFKKICFLFFFQLFVLQASSDNNLGSDTTYISATLVTSYIRTLEAPRMVARTDNSPPDTPSIFPRRRPESHVSYISPRGRFCVAHPCRYPCPCLWTCPFSYAFLSRPEHYTLAAAAGALPYQQRLPLHRWVWAAFSSLEAASLTHPPRTSAAPCPRTCGAVPGTTGERRYYDRL